MNRRKGTRGSALVEFCLTGIVLMFVWISIAEMARGMWDYHTLQYAAKAAGNYASVHGATCSISPNACTVAISDIATVFQHSAIGVPPDQVSLTFTTDSGAATTCSLAGSGSLCSSQTTAWPPSSNNDNEVGKFLSIRADFTFHSALAMFAPGNGSVQFGAFDLPGYTEQIIQY
ncbi:MAG TPA: TadE family protein [Bryobacteraceae bacterium]|nr:TadE family protein [Bryobacteraceae bacterium]